MLFEKINSDLITAMKAQDKVKVDTLRFLIAAVKKYDMDTYLPGSKDKMTEDEVVKILLKQIKTHKESVEAFSKAGRQDLVDQESAQLAILESYAPKGLDESIIRKTVIDAIASQGKDFGKVMKQVMGQLRGQADGAVVSKMVKEEMGK